MRDASQICDMCATLAYDGIDTLVFVTHTKCGMEMEMKMELELAMGSGSGMKTPITNRHWH